MSGEDHFEEPSPMDDDSFLHEEATHKTGSWDQFAGNAHLIKQPSTYNELLYTTPIPANIPHDWCKNAALISHEKPTPDTGREDGSDEESNHSRVLIGPDHNTQSPQSEKDSVARKFSRRRVTTIPPCAKGHIRGIIKTTKTREKTTPIRGEASDLRAHDKDPCDRGDSPAMELDPSAGTAVHEQTPPYFPLSQQQGTFPANRCEEDVDSAEVSQKQLEHGPTSSQDTPLPCNRVDARECPAQGCSWRSSPHGGSWQAFYNHVACRHGSSIPAEWWEGEGRFVCSSCGRNYDKSKRSSHSHSCQATKASSLPEPHAETLSEEDSPTLVDGTTQLELPSLSNICSLPLSTCKDVPHRCRQLWGEILTEAMDNAVKENTLQSWTLLAMLPKCVLPAPRRGGRKGHMAYASHAYSCMQRWLALDYSSLWQEATTNYRKKKVTPTEDSDKDEKAALRAELLARQGEYSRGMAALTSDPMTPDDDDTFSKLQEKHPCRLLVPGAANFFPAERVSLESICHGTIITYYY